MGSSYRQYISKNSKDTGINSFHLLIVMEGKLHYQETPMCSHEGTKKTLLLSWISYLGNFNTSSCWIPIPVSSNQHGQWSGITRVVNQQLLKGHRLPTSDTGTSFAGFQTELSQPFQEGLKLGFLHGKHVFYHWATVLPNWCSLLFRNSAFCLQNWSWVGVIASNSLKPHLDDHPFLPKPSEKAVVQLALKNCASEQMQIRRTPWFSVEVNPMCAFRKVIPIEWLELLHNKCASDWADLMLCSFNLVLLGPLLATLGSSDS